MKGKTNSLCGAFGLRFASDLALPEMVPLSADRPADVTVTLTRDPARRIDAETLWQRAQDGAAEFRLHGIGYRVSGGNRIAIEAPEGVAPEDIRVWLLGSVMGALLLQRGLLTLHANAVAIDPERAAAFCGDSGAGKSTLAAALRERGLRPLCDDLLAVEVDDEGVGWVRPGIARIKLGREGARHLGIDLAGAPRVAADIDKYQLPLDRREKDWDRRYRLDRIYRIEDGPLDIRDLRGQDAAAMLVANLFRPALGERLAGDEHRFRQAVRLADETPTFAYSRPRDWARLEASSDLLLAHLRR